MRGRNLHAMCMDIAAFMTGRDITGRLSTTVFAVDKNNCPDGSFLCTRQTNKQCVEISVWDHPVNILRANEQYTRFGAGRHGKISESG